jgi:hypothetical protein
MGDPPAFCASVFLKLISLFSSVFNSALLFYKLTKRKKEKAMKASNPIESGEAVVLKSKQLYGNHEMVLCKFRHEYVTWCRCPVTGHLYWGHYFKDIESAVSDYTDRN